MLTIIITTLFLMLCFTIINYLADLDMLGDMLGSGFVIGFILGFIISLCIPAEFETIKTSYELECIQDNSNINGSFFLGCGNINNNMVYMYYYKEDGMYRLGTKSYYNSYVKYCNEKPKLEIIEVKRDKDAFRNWFSLQVPIAEDKYIFYVPEGTVKTNYTLDAK